MHEEWIELPGYGPEVTRYVWDSCKGFSFSSAGRRKSSKSHRKKIIFLSQKKWVSQIYFSEQCKTGVKNN